MLVKQKDSSYIEIPEEVVIAAKLVEMWANKNDYKFWCLNGICDRRFSENNSKNNLSKWKK